MQMPQLFLALKMAGLISDAVRQVFEPLMVTIAQTLNSPHAAHARLRFFFPGGRRYQPQGLKRVTRRI
ncbi:hypothetical protein D3C78_1458100 [compost metagenome]